MQAPELRTPFDRARQAFLYEAGALSFAVPLLRAFTGEAFTESLALLVVISIIAMLWTAAWSAAFDRLEARHTGRPADRRPLLLRILHAAGLEGGLALLTIPPHRSRHRRHLACRPRRGSLSNRRLCRICARFQSPI